MRKMRSLCGMLLLAVLLAAQSAWAEVDPWAESYRLEALGQFDAAAKALEPVIRANAQHEFAFLRRGWLNYLRGDHNASLEDYRKALEINRHSLEARLGVILPLLAQQRWREAASEANKVLEVAPWNYYAHVRLMIAEEGERQWDILAKHAAQVAQHYPSDATVLVYLARANIWLGNNSAARRAYEQVLERVPGHIEALQYLAVKL